MFLTAVDIANRCLQHLGARRITAFTDNSKEAAETNFVYDKVRLAELRRNIWTFSIRRTVIRAIDSTTQVFTPAAWASTTTYAAGAVVSYASTYWSSVQGSNTNQTPGNAPSYWVPYFGSVYPDTFDGSSSYGAWSSVTTYQQGAIVSYNSSLWISLQGNNTNQTPQAGSLWWSAYSVTASYWAGDIVVQSGTPYLSLVNANTDIPPSSNWLALTGTLAPFAPLWPIGSGPSEQSFTRNVYPLPYGFLREAPQAPKQGSFSWLGAPTGRLYEDWEFDGHYLVTSNVEPIVFRFVADMQDVTRMDPMFCEGLAARMAIELAETFTQDENKLKMIWVAYNTAIKEARIVNGIEQGPEQSPIDDYIACRI